MTNQQLINKLSEFPPDMEVKFNRSSHDLYGCVDIHYIEKLHVGGKEVIVLDHD